MRERRCRMMSKGTLFVISAPSGSGKSTLIKNILASRRNTVFSVSMTTRKPRGEEKDKIDYHFVTKDYFKSRIEVDDFLEYAEYCDEFYGTPRTFVEMNIEQGNDVILEIDTQGARRIRSVCKDAVHIFVMPPSFEVLEQRLRDRATETEEKIQKRLYTARSEMTRADEYDYIVINDDLQEATMKMLSIMSAEKNKTERMKDKVSHLINKENVN
ncbi:MAG: guanylate kinase [Ruminococcaceae bacterium]|nr:guanylate kinase [Oscillospiraceae bacterium]